MGGLIAGSLGCMVFYMILPGMGINMQMTGQVDLMSIMNEQGRGAVVYAMLEQMPLGTLFVFAFGLITLISYITGHCAVGYSLAAATQDEIAENEDPAHWNIAFWLILAGVVSLALYFINPESLKPLQTVSILTGFPLCFVIAIVAKSFIKQINIDFPEGFPAADSKGRIYLETPVDRVEEEQVTKPATEPTTSFS